jgi:hypothetical protein
MRPLAFVLLVVALHLGVASVAASRHLLLAQVRAPLELPLLACDPVR